MSCQCPPKLSQIFCEVILHLHLIPLVYIKLVVLDSLLSKVYAIPVNFLLEEKQVLIWIAVFKADSNELFN